MHRIVELIFPFCELSLLTLGSCGWYEKPVIIRFYYRRWSRSPQPGAETAQRASPPACGPCPAEGLLLQERVFRTRGEFAPLGTLGLSLHRGKIPLLSAGTAGGAGGTEQEQGFAEQLRKDGGDALDAGAAVWGGLGGWGGLVAPHGGDTAMQTKPQGNLGEPRWGLIQQ